MRIPDDGYDDNQDEDNHDDGSDDNQDDDQVWGWTIRKLRVGAGAKLAHQSHS